MHLFGGHLVRNTTGLRNGPTFAGIMMEYSSIISSAFVLILVGYNQGQVDQSGKISD